MTTDVREWFSSAAGRKVTATEIADHLGVARNTANKRIADGLNAGDIITISRAVNVNPVEALTDLGYLTITEAFDFVDADGKLLATADDHDLLLELADRTLSVADLAGLLSRRTDGLMNDGYTAPKGAAADELAQRRGRTGLSEVPVNVPIAAHRGEVGIETPMSDGEGPQVDPNEDDNFEHP